MKHNPDNLTDEQVESRLGWRLLDADEIIRVDVILPTGIQGWMKEWHDRYEGSDAGVTYRTKLSREELADRRTKS